MSKKKISFMEAFAALDKGKTIVCEDESIFSEYYIPHVNGIEVDGEEMGIDDCIFSAAQIKYGKWRIISSTKKYASKSEERRIKIQKGNK
jgi:hypothetical protein